MKINIKKMQGGGLLTYEPLPSFPSQGTPPPPPVEAPISEELQDQMVGKGITNDVMEYVKELNSTYSSYDALPEAIRNSSVGRGIRQSLKGDRGKLNEIVRNKEYFDKTLETKKKAMSEYAVSDGQVIVKDANNNLSSLSLNAYATQLQSGEPKFKAVTNEEVRYAREKDPRFANNNSLIDVLTHAVSTDEVLERVRKSLSDIGSFTKGDSDVSYEQQQTADGANAALNKGLSYVKTSEGNYAQSNAENIKRAGHAAWATLSEDDKNLFRMKVISTGLYKPEQTEAAALGMALALLQPKETEVIKTTAGEGKPGGPKAGAVNKAELGYWKAYTTQQGIPENITLLNGDSNKVTMRGWTMSPFESDKKMLKGPTSIDKIPELGSVGEMGSVYFGDQKVESHLFDSVIYDNSKPIIVMMPFESQDDGSFKPDLERAQDLEDAQKIIKDQHIVDPELKKEIYKQHGDFQSFDVKGDPTQNVEVRPFISFSAYTNSNAIKGDSKWFSPKDEKYDWYKKQFEEGPKKTVSSSYFDTHMFSGWSKPEVLKGMVYIPMRQGAGFLSNYADQTSVKLPTEFEENSAYAGNKRQSTTFRQLDQNMDLSTKSLQQ